MAAQGSSRRRRSSTKSRPARPDRLTEALGLLESGVLEITTGEDFRRYLALAARFHRYSARNCLLILAQCPDASRVAGYRAWQAMGRQVRKGETCISILAPVSYTREDEATGEKIRTLSGFRAAAVFDVSQTDGEPLPEAPRPEALDATAGDPETAARILEGLSRMCAAEGVDLEEQDLAAGYYGYYEPAARRVVLASWLSPLERATTLAHELAHHLQRTSEGQDTPQSKQARETEAEGSTFAVFSYFGLDTARFSFPYIARYAEKPEVLAESLERIQKAARRLIEAVEKAEPGTAGGCS